MNPQDHDAYRKGYSSGPNDVNPYPWTDDLYWMHELWQKGRAAALSGAYVPGLSSVADDDDYDDGGDADNDN